MIEIGNTRLGIDKFREIVFDEEKIQLNSEALEKIDETYNFLSSFSEGKIIYGINTGLGPMAQFRVPEKDLNQLQHNLISSHCCGSGEALDRKQIRSLMLSRLNSLMQGYSGIHSSAVVLLKDMLNCGIYPLIYEHGGVGASGDLVQLAHLANGMLGEGNVYFNDKICPAKKAFKECGIYPLRIYLREGLAIMNGTSVMSGIGLLNIINAKNLYVWSLVCSAIINEIVRSYSDHFSAELNRLKHHKGQILTAKLLRKILKGSKLIRRRADHLYNGSNGHQTVLKDKVQEYYSLRCVPQILGPVWDTLENAERIVLDELNSVNDNPIIDKQSNDVFHGGNFHGDYVSFEMDKLKIAITKLSMLSERQLNFLMNDKLNNILPPFINLGTLGLNFGMQGLQFTAVSTTAENQTLSYPMYLHSIPSNNDNQDLVSMGTNSALIAKKVIENTYQVVAIELIALAQAIDYLKIENELAEFSSEIYGKIRSIVPRFENDESKYEQLKSLKDFLYKDHFDLSNLIS